MCGIVGIAGNYREEELQESGKALLSGISHRGPDSHGVWIDRNAGLLLGHTRLAIIDLSPNGHQPMASATGRFTISFNGEIYNFLELRSELENVGFSFKGGSDTEVMLAAFEQWGVQEALKKFNGMFAFALWDTKEQTLFLARDRFGEKPLYYGWTDRGFYFGSELKPLQRLSPSLTISNDAVAAFMRYSYVPQPFSIYSEIYKLPQGSYLPLRKADLHSKPAGYSPFVSQGAPRPYYSIEEVALQAFGDPFKGTEDDAADELDALLTQAVKIRMISDVKLGAFLSGGIDSSLIVALMQKQSSQPIRTFSIGFNEAEFDEAPYAKKVALHLGTDHTELYLPTQRSLEVVPHLPDIYDEPFGDSSQIPTYLVAKLAREHVTVSLSGDAGDELFAGYRRYHLGEKMYKAVSRVPSPLLSILNSVPSAFSEKMALTSAELLGKATGKSFLFNRLAHRGLRALDISKKTDLADFYQDLVSQWYDTDALVPGSEPHLSVRNAFSDRTKDFPLQRRFMLADLQTYLPDDILTKVDRAAMAVALETRIPFLDPAVVRFSLRLPMHFLAKGSENKALLRKLLYRYVPRALVDRTKMGFGTPHGKWLRSELASRFSELHNHRRDSLLNHAVIDKTWRAHVRGTRSSEHQLWNVLQFLSWRERYHK